MFDIAEFSSVISKNSGLQRTTLFSVSIPVPPGLQNSSYGNTAFQDNAKELMFFIEQCRLPGAQFATVKNRRHGYGPTEDVPYGVVMEPLTTRILGDGQMIIWNYLFTWFQYIQNFDVIGTGSLSSPTGTQTPQGGYQYPYEMAYRTDYGVDMTITTYNQRGQSTSSIVLRSAYPRYIEPIPMSWADKNGIVRIPVEFSFIDWKNETNPYTLQPPNIQTIVRGTAQRLQNKPLPFNGGGGGSSGGGGASDSF